VNDAKEKQYMKIIGMSGYARSGKDTVGNYILEKYKNNAQYSLADPIKKAASIIFDVPLDYFYNPLYKEVVIEFWGFSPREMAQLLGTEGCRNVFMEDIWLKRAELEIEKSSAEYFIIPDIRFPNEASWMNKMNGTLIHIIRDGCDGNVGKANHQSEAGYDLTLAHHIITNNGTLEELYKKIENIPGLI